jgi:hypothetical protein
MSQHYSVLLNGELAAMYSDREDAEAGAARHHDLEPKGLLEVRDDRGLILWTPEWRAD